MEIILNEPINWFAASGLILDLAGVLLLFQFGLPSKVELDVRFLNVGNPNSENSKRIKRKNKRIHFWAFTGLTLIGIGFLLQLAGVFFKTV
ncbi:MAG TPA: hypothetical protein VGN63_03305 [Flavisolibacter sp.]|jgi:drug/metabolite transporter (DMT)-like permease|nr:hypothetical protein [Flavisolibacter sp.]